MTTHPELCNWHAGGYAILYRILSQTSGRWSTRKVPGRRFYISLRLPRFVHKTNTVYRLVPTLRQTGRVRNRRDAAYVRVAVGEVPFAVKVASLVGRCLVFGSLLILGAYVLCSVSYFFFIFWSVRFVVT